MGNVSDVWFLEGVRVGSGMGAGGIFGECDGLCCVHVMIFC